MNFNYARLMFIGGFERINNYFSFLYMLIMGRLDYYQKILMSIINELIFLVKFSELEIWWTILFFQFTKNVFVKNQHPRFRQPFPTLLVQRHD